MNTGQIVEFLKKNAVSVAAGVAALAALLVLFFYINPQYADLRRQVNERGAREQEAQSLLSKQRPMVQISAPGSPTGAERQLEGFPTQQVIASGRSFMEQVKAQANGVLEQAVDANRRLPLGQRTYEAAVAAWPLEGDARLVVRRDYVRLYQQYLNADNRFSDGAYPANTIQRMMQGTRPPSADEIADAQANLEGQLLATEPVNDRGRPLDAEGFAARFAEAKLTLAARRRFERASENLVYVDANEQARGFSVHPVVTSDRPTAEDLFDAQVGLWVQETVASNVLRANREAVASLPEEDQNILGAPIKHLLSIRVPDRFTDATAASPGMMTGGEDMRGRFGGGGNEGFTDDTEGWYGGEDYDPYGGTNPYLGGGQPQPTPQAGAGAAPAAPAAPPAGGGVRRGGRGPAAAEQPAENGSGVDLPVDAAADITPDFNRSPTGRPAHTPFYDTVRFNVTLRVDAASVPLVLHKLQRDALLSITNVEMQTVDPAVAAAEGYLYGTRPVVELALQCEMVFLRSWLIDFMPTSLKQSLGGAEGQTAGFEF